MSRDDRRLAIRLGMFVTTAGVLVGGLLGALVGVLTWLDESAEDDL